MNQSALDVAKELAPDLWHIHNLLTPDEMHHLSENIRSETAWTHVDLQEHKPRRQIVWQENGILDWVWLKLQDLDFSRFRVKFQAVTIWQDTAGYSIKSHVDNDRVYAAMQIYLSQSHENLSTWFDPDIEIPFVQNSGYFMHNRNKPVHGMRNSVPVGYDRVSLYALFDAIDHARDLHR